MSQKRFPVPLDWATTAKVDGAKGQARDPRLISDTDERWYVDGPVRDQSVLEPSFYRSKKGLNPAHEAATYSQIVSGVTK